MSRLRASTRRRVFSPSFAEAIVGRVSESRVRLERMKPPFSNGFKPVFVGAFEHRAGRVVLAGRFTMLRSARVLVALWVALAVAGPAVAVVNALRMPSPASDGRAEGTLLASLLFAGVLVLGALAIPRGYRWLSRGDVGVLTATIQEALGRAAPDLTPRGRA